MGEYTDSFKETMVKKMAGAEARSAMSLAAEVGVPPCRPKRLQQRGEG